jgi:hypothetical protein
MYRFYDQVSNMNSNNLQFLTNNQFNMQQTQQQSISKYNIDYLNNLMNTNNSYNMQLSNSQNQQFSLSLQNQLHTTKYDINYLNNMFNCYNYGSTNNYFDQAQCYEMKNNTKSVKKISITKNTNRARPIMNGVQSNASYSLSSDLNTNIDTKNDQNVSTYSPSSYTIPTTNLNSQKLNCLEEKLATTGNIFQKRDDWSLLDKLPVNKQNTIHLRLEDDGPYGNDEIRCFVLSHFSSLGLKEIPCVFCDCNLVIYDRFPLIDGTLFLSPISYDSKRSIPTRLSSNEKNDKNSSHHKPNDLIQKVKHQYINAICLKCLTHQKDHDIKCKYCNTTWQSKGGSALQVGTLYKYDIFAAFPCCQPRLDCLKCSTHIINADSACHEYFSAFSDEKECHKCKTRAYHFVKPLDEIYVKSACHQPNNMTV